jgi:hypothetical protein
MRRSFLTAAIGLTLLLPAAAQAKTASASAGGVTATLTYATDVAGPATTTGQVLVITEHGKTVYQQQPPNTGCYKACTPIGKHPVQLASLYGNDGEDVVLTLWSGGADCCTRADVYVPSAALGSYVLDQHNFGEAGFALRDIGPSGRPLFVSANNAYYCSITICAASALPLQIFEFEAERFVDVTRAYPQLIAKDAGRWLKLYYKHPAQGEGAIAAWAADDYLLGSKYKATVNTVLQLQYADHHLSNSFVKSLDKLLAKQP